MSIHTILLPDVGEGIAEAELMEWHVKLGDFVKEDDILAVVMTDKAAIEIPCACDGKVQWLAGEIGDMIAIGSPLLKLEIDGDVEDQRDDTLPLKADLKDSNPAEKAVSQDDEKAEIDRRTHKILTSPSIRKQAKDTGVDLRKITGTGPKGRITRSDFDDYLAQSQKAGGGMPNKLKTGVHKVKLVGMRRKIAQKMTLSKSRIPHITIIEEIDMTNVEDLRKQLNIRHKDTRIKLTVIPFMMRAIVEAVKDQPQMNAHFDDDAGIISHYDGIHCGIATQTPNGLTVPVVKHAEALNLWESADDVYRLASSARDGKATIDVLTGSTITITSLGALGALASTPIINHPEVSIVGINKMAIRPMWDGQQFQPRKMMNISCSFDHRVIDGWDAAVFVQKIKTLLETPALLFIEG